MLSLAIGQSGELHSFSDSTHPIRTSTAELNSPTIKDLPGSLQLFLLEHLISEQFELRLSPDVDHIAHCINEILSDMTYTFTFENEYAGIPYMAMATLFPTIEKGSLKVRKKVCFVDFTTLLESYEIIITTITDDSGSIEASVLWKKLPDTPYHIAHFEWHSLNVESNRQELIIDLDELSGSAITAELFDSIGRSVLTTISKRNQATLTIPTNGFSPGIYQLVLKSNLKTVFVKSVKLGSI